MRYVRYIATLIVLASLAIPADARGLFRRAIRQPRQAVPACQQCQPVQRAAPSGCPGGVCPLAPRKPTVVSLADDCICEAVGGCDCVNCKCRSVLRK